MTGWDDSLAARDQSNWEICKSEADALLSRLPGRAIGVRVADCAALLLACPHTGAVAAVHAGWRGVVAGVVPAAIREMLGDGSDPAARSTGTIIAAIGPGIGGEAFEVGPDVLAEFRRAFGADAPVRGRADGKGWVDLRAAVRRQLVAAGVGTDHVDSTDRCTYRDAGEFFSHRRENGVTGRMAAIISPGV